MTVTLTFRDNRLDVEILDDGTAHTPVAPNAGHGIVGMRERIALLGGDLETGRRIEGGFRVAATVPIDGDR